MMKPWLSKSPLRARPVRAVALFGLVALALASCSSSPSKTTSPPASSGSTGTTAGASDCGSTLTIGVHDTTSGPAGGYGQSEYQGMQLWASDVNSQGGILGAKVKLVLQDDGGDASQSAAVARTLVQDGIKIVEGPLSPITGPTAAPIYASNNVLAMAAVAGGPDFESTTTDQTSFTLGAPRDAQALFIANYLKQRGLTNVGVLYSSDPFGTPFSQSFQSQAAGLKLTVQQMTSTDTDVTQQLNAMRDAGAQAVVLFVQLPSPEIATVLSGMDSIKWVVPVVGPVVVGGAPWNLHPALAAKAGYAEYSWAVSGTSSEAASVASRLGNVSEFDQAIAGYADGVVIADVIKQVGSCDVSKILPALRQFTGTVLGVPINFAANAPQRYGGVATSLKMAKVGVVQNNQAVPLG